MSLLREFKLKAAENKWVRSSFLRYIDMIGGDHELHIHLESMQKATMLQYVVDKNDHKSNKC
uniref:Uncharacterized protein n=1 Tax=Physcomitrium patens TaxID=3218 RepID=A0A2K1JJE3_PHYPA|nr:hypothetical protein PHYPA_019080 [Physcomitrium patens]